jgi:hypothetical protein
MIYRLITAVIVSLCIIPHTIYANVYTGRVFTINNEPISYATIYPIDDPISGTATNDAGIFHFSTNLPPDSKVIISFLGYEKAEVPLAALTDSATIILKEQPIALEETVVAAKASKQKNKRKHIASLLHSVYVQMANDFSDNNVEYCIVSDVRMDSEGEAWGMEQMIARVVNLPYIGHNGEDSIQMEGLFCKRYFKPSIRELVDSIYLGKSLDRMTAENKKRNKNSKFRDKDFRKIATSVDSGTVVHKSLWSHGNIRYDFEKNASDLKHWVVSNESEGETVLTYTESKNYLGIVKYSIQRHFILDSKTLSVRRFSERGELYVNIPFGYKLNQDQLQMLNLLNMSDNQIEKFRLRKANGVVLLNTIYQRRDGHLYILEKNLKADAKLTGTKQMEIPTQVRATQRVTSLKTENVQPMPKSQITKRIKRQIVEIY